MGIHHLHEVGGVGPSAEGGRDRARALIVAVRESHDKDVAASDSSALSSTTVTAPFFLSSSILCRHA